MNFQSDELSHIIIKIGGSEIYIHATVITWIFICLFLSVLFILLGLVIRTSDPTKPGKLAILIEAFYNFIHGLVVENAGERNKKWIPYVGAVFLAMFISNIIGLFGVQTPTSNLGLTATLGIASFVFIQTTGLVKKGLGHLKGYFEPIFILAPINIIGDFSLPISLSVRLFANIFSGFILLSLVYAVWGMLADIVVLQFVINFVAAFLHGYFDVFVGFLQTYVFFTLTMYFIGDASEIEEEEEQSEKSVLGTEEVLEELI